MSTPQELTPDVLRALQQHLLAQGAVLPDGVNLQQALAYAQQSAAAAGTLPEPGSDGGDTESENEDTASRRSSERLTKGKQGAGKGGKDKTAGGRGLRQKGKDADDDDPDERAKGGKQGKGGSGAAKDTQPPRKKAKLDAAVGSVTQFDPLRNLDVLAAAALAQANVELPVCGVATVVLEPCTEAAAAAVTSAVGTAATTAPSNTTPPKLRVAVTSGPSAAAVHGGIAAASGPVRGLPPLAGIIPAATAGTMGGALIPPTAAGGSPPGSGVRAVHLTTAVASSATGAGVGAAVGTTHSASSEPESPRQGAAPATATGFAQPPQAAIPSSATGGQQTQPASLGTSPPLSQPVSGAVFPTKPRARRPPLSHTVNHRQPAQAAVSWVGPGSGSDAAAMTDGGIDVEQPDEVLIGSADRNVLDNSVELLSNEEQLQPPQSLVGVQQPHQVDPSGLLTSLQPSLLPPSLAGAVATFASIAGTGLPSLLRLPSPQPTAAAGNHTGGALSAGAASDTMAAANAAIPTACTAPPSTHDVVAAALLPSSLSLPSLSFDAVAELTALMSGVPVNLDGSSPLHQNPQNVIPAGDALSASVLAASSQPAAHLHNGSVPLSAVFEEGSGLHGGGTEAGPSSVLTATRQLLPLESTSDLDPHTHLLPHQAHQHQQLPPPPPLQAAPPAATSAAAPTGDVSPAVAATVLPTGGMALPGMDFLSGNDPMMVASLIQAALANHEATAALGVSPGGGGGSGGHTQLSELLMAATAGGQPLAAAMAAMTAAAEGLMAPGGLMGQELGPDGGAAGLQPNADSNAFAAAMAAAVAGTAGSGRKRGGAGGGKRRGGGSAADSEYYDDEFSEDEALRKEPRDRRAPAQCRRFYEPAMKVTFDEGMKLADGRIYVPLPFVHKNFAEQQFPLRLPADIYVNGDMIQEGFVVKIARSQNKTRRHGLGNHWVTGHQRLIKHYKDVRLMGLELVDDQRLKILLSASGVWDEAASTTGSRQQQQQLPAAQQQSQQQQQQQQSHLGAPGMGGVPGLPHPSLLGLPPGAYSSGFFMKPDGTGSATTSFEQLSALLSMQAAAVAAAAANQNHLMTPHSAMAGLGMLHHHHHQHSAVAANPQQQPIGSLTPSGGAAAATAATAAASSGPNTFLAMLGGAAAAGTAPTGAAGSGYATALPLPLLVTHMGPGQPHQEQQQSASHQPGEQQEQLLHPAELEQQAQAAADRAAGSNAGGGTGGEGPAHVNGGGGCEGGGNDSTTTAGETAAERDSSTPAPLNQERQQQQQQQQAYKGYKDYNAMPSGSLTAALGLQNAASSAVAAAAAAVDAAMAASLPSDIAESGHDAAGHLPMTSSPPDDVTAADSLGEAALNEELQQLQQQQQQRQPQEGTLPWGTLGLVPGAVHPLLLSHPGLYHHQHLMHQQTQQQLSQQQQHPQQQHGSQGVAGHNGDDATFEAASAQGAAVTVVPGDSSSPGGRGGGGDDIGGRSDPAAGASSSGSSVDNALAVMHSLMMGPSGLHHQSQLGHFGAAHGPPDQALSALPAITSLTGATAPESQPGASPFPHPSHNFLAPLMQQQQQQQGAGAMQGAGLGGHQDGQAVAAAAAAAAAAAGHMGPLSALMPAGMMGGAGCLNGDLLAAAAANGQWSMDAFQTLFAAGTQMGFLGLSRVGPVMQPHTTLSNANATGNQQYPRLYDGRIHVPLNLINSHFANVEFPVSVQTKVIINSDVVGESVQARIVKYKKHRRPFHFNYWITGLQKTLARYNDVRQAGVSMEPGCAVIRVNLVAASN